MSPTGVSLTIAESLILCTLVTKLVTHGFPGKAPRAGGTIPDYKLIPILTLM